MDLNLPFSYFAGSPNFALHSNEDDLNYLNPDIMVIDSDNNADHADQSNQTLLPAEQQHQSLRNTPFSNQSNGNLDFKQRSKPSLNESNGLEPRLDPLMGEDTVQDPSPNFIMGLDNPEYMMLQGSTSEKDALLNDDTSEA